jgi:hypothetical protein
VIPALLWLIERLARRERMGRAAHDRARRYDAD